jgi:hypothetical protein
MMSNKIDLLAIYEIYRRQIKDEDELYHKRLTLFCTLNGAAIIVFGIPNISESSMILASLVGLYSSVVTLLTLTAAQKSIDRITSAWEVVLDRDRDNPSFDKLPLISGDRGKHNLIFRSRYLPVAFGFVWIFLLVLHSLGASN